MGFLMVVVCMIAAGVGGHSDAVHKAAKDPAYAQKALKHLDGPAKPASEGFGGADLSGG